MTASCCLSFATPAPAPAVHACQQQRLSGEDHGLTCQALRALNALAAALGRLIDGHCEQGIEGCALCADADGLRYVVESGARTFNSEVIPPDGWLAHGDRRQQVRPAGGRVSPGLAVVLTLWDALDALLDLVAGHCPSWDCPVCTAADSLVYHVRAGIEQLAGGLPATVREVERALERELLSAERKLTRLAEGGGFLPHAAREHQGAADEVVSGLRALHRLRTRHAQ